MSEDTHQGQESFALASGRLVEQFLEFFQDYNGDKADFERLLAQFGESIAETAASEFSIAASAVGPFVDGQISILRGILQGMNKIAQNFGLCSVTPTYGTPRDLSKQSMGFPGQYITKILLSGRGFGKFSDDDEALVGRFVAAMAEDIAVHDYCDTKPYTDHWGGMTDGEFDDLARRIVIDLNTLHASEDSNGQAMGLTREQRIEDIEDLLLKCKGTVYAMWKLSLYEECLRDPRGMQIRFIDNQKNNWQKKAEGRKRKLREAEIEEATAGPSRGKKRRTNKKKAAELSLDELGMEYFDDPRGTPDKPPPKPAARRIPGAVKAPGVPRKMHRGPRFRAIQAIMAGLGEPQSAAPPPSLGAFEPDSPAGGISAIRDVARARATRLEVEALRARLGGVVSEAEGRGEAPIGAAETAEFDSSDSGEENADEEGIGMIGPEENPVEYAMAQAVVSDEEYPGGPDGQKGLPSDGLQFALPSVDVEQSQFGLPPPLLPSGYLGTYAEGCGSAIEENDHRLGMPVGDRGQAFTGVGGGGVDMSAWNIDPTLGGFTALGGRGGAPVNYRGAGCSAPTQVSWGNDPLRAALAPLGGEIASSGGTDRAPEGAISEVPPAVAYTEGESCHRGFLYESLLYDGLPPDGQKAGASHGNVSLKASGSARPQAPSWGAGDDFLVALATQNGRVAEVISRATFEAFGNDAQSPTSDFDGACVPHGPPEHPGERAIEGVGHAEYEIGHGATDNAVQDSAAESAPFPEPDLHLTSGGQVTGGNSGASGMEKGDTCPPPAPLDSPSTSSASLGGSFVYRPQLDLTGGEIQDPFSDINATEAKSQATSAAGAGPLDLVTSPQSASVFDNDFDNKLLHDFNFFVHAVEGNSGLNISPEATKMCSESGGAAQEGAGRG